MESNNPLRSELIRQVSQHISTRLLYIQSKYEKLWITTLIQTFDLPHLLLFYYVLSCSLYFSASTPSRSLLYGSPSIAKHLKLFLQSSNMTPSSVTIHYCQIAKKTPQQSIRSNPWPLIIILLIHSYHSVDLVSTSAQVKMDLNFESRWLWKVRKSLQSLIRSTLTIDPQRWQLMWRLAARRQNTNVTATVMSSVMATNVINIMAARLIRLRSRLTWPVTPPGQLDLTCNLDS